MSKNVSWTQIAWKQYVEWQTSDKKTLNRINSLIKDIYRNGLTSGIGKPEILKQQKKYSRRIDSEHRLVYDADSEGNLLIYSCKGHYE